jgi:hypothetical protein
MSTCQAFPTKTKAQAIEGFCDEFPGFCQVSTAGLESVPSDVEETILLDDVSTNDKNDCDGGFNFELVCPTACGQPESTVSATYSVVADAFGGGEECPYHDGFVIEKTCPATPGCAVPCEGSWTSPPCPSACGTPASTPSKTWSMETPAENGGSCPNTGPAPTYSCPATPACPADCSGGSWSYTCPTQCGYGGGNVTATLVDYNPAVGTGSCTTTKNVYCPAQPSCPACEYTAWEYSGDCVNGWQKSERSVTNAPCYSATAKKTLSRTTTLGGVGLELDSITSDTVKSESCTPCEHGWVFSHHIYSYDNPRKECTSYGRKCYCTRYRWDDWQVVTPAVNTSCPAEVGYSQTADGEWEGCTGCDRCPARAHPGLR